MIRVTLRAAASLAMAIVTVPAAQAAEGETRYSLAGGCYALQAPGGRLVSEPLRMQATELGRYLLFDKGGKFVSGDPSGSVTVAPAPSANGDWRVDGPGPFTLTLPEADKSLGVDDAGTLVLVEPAAAAAFVFVPSQGCATYPEIEIGAVGRPYTRAPAYGEVRGLLDMHMHLMSFEAYGGEYHCGRPWHRYGAAYALPDCAEMYGPQAGGAPVQSVVDTGSPVSPHDTRGWPTFAAWPAWNRSNYEQTYYRWIERAWRGGLRILVPLHNDNQVLCELMPRKRTNCNEMDTVRRQIADTYALQDYIDAQSGGPGAGWFRVVTDPFEARRVINTGKLAVVHGIETSELFDCNIYTDVPQCDRAQVDRGLDEVYRLGVRQMSLLNKFDNAFAGVAGDGGINGIVVNTGNFLLTGRWWQMQTCTGQAHDVEQETPTHNHMLDNALASLLPPGTAPVYPAAPHCNARGLSDLGGYLIRRMAQRGVLFDADHLSAHARSHALALVAALRYSGVISSHSWSDELTYPEVYELGGVVTPYAGGSERFAENWGKRRGERDPRYLFGIGYGSDVHGLTWLGGPREGPDPVSYPFKSFDGGVTLERQRSGERTFDVNKDGVAHYGLYPDWVEDLRLIAGQQIIEDLARGAEAYLQTWERAAGIPGPRCRSLPARFSARGLGAVRLGVTPDALLRAAGQPQSRKRAWRWCVEGRANASVVAVFTPRGRVGLVLSTAWGHIGDRVRPGSSVGALRAARARAVGRGLWRRGRVVYGVRKRRVRWVAIAARSVAAEPARLSAYARLALR